MNLNRTDNVCREPPDGHTYKPHRVENEHGHKYQVYRCEVCGNEFAKHIEFPQDWQHRRHDIVDAECRRRLGKRDVSQRNHVARAFDEMHRFLKEKYEI